MPERIVVSNTSPLQYLHQVGLLDLLEKLYGEVLVPPAVQEELRAGERRGIARLNGLTCTGTLGVLLRAKQNGLLSSVSPVLQELQRTTMWLSNDLIALVLAEAGE
jgi:predicted nucleic acid-binding protein